MHQHQYVQHDWSPLVWAEMLTALSVVVVLGLCLFLLFATRSQQPHHAGGSTGGEMQQRPRLDAGTAGPARL